MEHLPTIFKVLETGSPWAVTALVIVWGMTERKERKESQATLFELANKQTATNMKIEASINALKDLLNQIANRI